MIKLARPAISPAAIAKVSEVLASGNLVQGAYVLKFEEQLQKYLDVNHVIVVSSGTAALHLSLICLGIGPGDEVIVPSFTFPATANVVELVGAKPVFVDIGLDDFCIDTTQIEKVITLRTKAIMPVHEFGQSADMEAIMQMARKYDLAVIEDAACALGTEFASRKAGTFGVLGCFSFHPRKAITTGEGGAIVTNDDALAAALRSLRNHGMNQISGKIDFSSAGFNYRLTDFQAVLGYCQMTEIVDFISQRIRMAESYALRLHGLSKIKTPVVFSNRKNVYQTYHILLDSSVDRDRLKTLLFENGVETNYGAYAVPVQSFYREKYALREEDFPNAVMAYRHGLALPLGSYLTDSDITCIVDQLKTHVV